MGKIVMIAAISDNFAIGRDNGLLWNISEDLKRFKKMTLGHEVLMGRKTFESILKMNGKPLVGRNNIVVSKTLEDDGKWDNVFVFDDLEAALESVDEGRTLFVIGGGDVYGQMIYRCDLLEITHVRRFVDDTDVFFPDFRHLVGLKFRIVSTVPHEDFDFVTYEVLK